MPLKNPNALTQAKERQDRLEVRTRTCTGRDKVLRSWSGKMSVFCLQRSRSSRRANFRQFRCKRPRSIHVGFQRRICVAWTISPLDHPIGAAPASDNWNCRQCDSDQGDRQVWRLKDFACFLQSFRFSHLSSTTGQPEWRFRHSDQRKDAEQYRNRVRPSTMNADRPCRTVSVGTGG